DVRELRGAGGGGGLAGRLAGVGGELVLGLAIVADVVDLEQRLRHADLVVTGEGHLDAQSFAGKVVGGVATAAATAGVELFVVAGAIDDDVRDRVPTVSLVERYGTERAMRDPLGCISEVVRDHLASTRA
ncbi:MAG: glycerate kinase, partial [Ilumatobacteraceae bacterium]